MAYVYNQNKDEEAPQAGSNIFNNQPQQQPDSGAISKTGDTGIIGAGGVVGGQEKSTEQVQKQSGQQSQAAFPLREIFKRNSAAQVGAPDFSKTSNAIASAGTAFQNAANAYITSNSVVPTIDQGTVNTYAGIPPVAGPTLPSETAEQAGNKITSAITPRQASLTKFEMPDETNLPTKNELSSRFNTSSGLTNELLKGNPVVGQSRGAAGLDTAFLQGNTDFQKSKDAILGSGNKALAERGAALAALPETARVSAQAAIDKSAADARALLTSTASGYETDANAKQAAFENSRKELQGRLDRGDLSPEMRAQILSSFDAQASGLTPNQRVMSDDYRRFLADPNRMDRASSLAGDITSYGGDAGNYNLNNFNDANLAKGFSVAGTPTNATSFMTDDQYNPWSKISGLLGKDVTRGAAAATQPFAYDPTNAINAAMQYQGMQDALGSGKKNYNDTKTIVQNKINELNALKNEKRVLNPQQYNNAVKEVQNKERELQDLFKSSTTKLSRDKQRQMYSELFPMSADEKAKGIGGLFDKAPNPLPGAQQLRWTRSVTDKNKFYPKIK